MSKYRMGMARPKRLTAKTTLRLDQSTLERIDRVLTDDEDRAVFIRSGTERELSFREAKLISAVQEYVFRNESVTDFCITAIKRAIENRRLMIASEKAGLGPEHPKNKIEDQEQETAVHIKNMK
ncbi:hypothetical protein [Acidiphilium acidophilum]|nr:hypothetical protein [Acidiphilium acidophilum]